MAQSKHKAGDRMMKRSVDFNDADLIKELERVLNEHAAQILKVNDIALTSYDIYLSALIMYENT